MFKKHEDAKIVRVPLTKHEINFIRLALIHGAIDSAKTAKEIPGYARNHSRYLTKTTHDFRSAEKLNRKLCRFQFGWSQPKKDGK